MGLGGSEGELREQRQQGWNAHAAGKGLRATLFLNRLPPLPMPSSPATQACSWLLVCCSERFRASAGGVGMSILLAGVVVWISVVGLLPWPWGWMSLFQLGPDQNAYAQISEVCSLHPPSSLYPAPPVGRVQRGLGRDLVLSS